MMYYFTDNFGYTHSSMFFTTIVKLALEVNVNPRDITTEVSTMGVRLPVAEWDETKKVLLY